MISQCECDGDAPRLFSGTENGLEMEPEDFYGAQDDEFRVLNAVSEVHPSAHDPPLAEQKRDCRVIPYGVQVSIGMTHSFHTV